MDGQCPNPNGQRAELAGMRIEFEPGGLIVHAELIARFGYLSIKDCLRPFRSEPVEQRRTRNCVERLAIFRSIAFILHVVG